MVSSAELLKDSTLKPGSLDTVANLDSEMDHIRALYARASATVAITANVERAAKGHVTVTFAIDESFKDPGLSHTVASGAETGPSIPPQPARPQYFAERGVARPPRPLRRGG